MDVGKGFHWAHVVGDSGDALLSRRVENDEADLLALIEEAFSKVKGLLRRAEARTREALGRALDAVTAQGTRGFFGHCGYRRTDQLL